LQQCSSESQPLQWHFPEPQLLQQHFSKPPHFKLKLACARAARSSCTESCTESWDEASERCEASLRNLKEILWEAETESAECAMERLTQSVKSGGVDGIGKITRIPFRLLTGSARRFAEV
jgi:hypothetical protein